MTLDIVVYASPTRDIPGGTFSPITSTLLVGRTEVVVVDTGFHVDDVEELGDLIASTGRTLTSVLLTHAHADHCFGGGRLLERFPGARLQTTSAVAADLGARVDQERALADALLGASACALGRLPEAADGGRVAVDGEEVRLVDVGQGDIAPSAIVHVPSAGVVCAGDVAYNGIHQMLGLAGPAGWQAWLASVDAVAALHPERVVAGHKRPGRDDDAGRVLGETRGYLEAFEACFAASGDAEDLVAAMTARFPDHGNVTTLRFSAAQALRRRDRGHGGPGRLSAALDLNGSARLWPLGLPAAAAGDARRHASAGVRLRREVDPR